MRRIFKILTCFLAAIGVCTAALVCFILLYPLFHGNFSPNQQNASPEKTEAEPSLADEAAAPETADPETTDRRAASPTPAANSEIPSPVRAAPTGSDIESPHSQESPSAQTPTETPVKEEIPAEYQSALNRADNYCDLMHMSKQAIYDQLISEYGENVSPEAASYAVTHVNADWNANALQKATVYSDTMHMSRTAIYDQLISENGEKFTEAQAQYAMEHLEADWMANALYKAKEYRQSTNMTKSAIYNQLISEHGDKFSPEEASYAIKNLK